MLMLFQPYQHSYLCKHFSKCIFQKFNEIFWREVEDYISQVYLELKSNFCNSFLKLLSLK